MGRSVKEEICIIDLANGLKRIFLGYKHRESVFVVKNKFQMIFFSGGERGGGWMIEMQSTSVLYISGRYAPWYPLFVFFRLIFDHQILWPFRMWTRSPTRSRNTIQSAGNQTFTTNRQVTFSAYEEMVSSFKFPNYLAQWKILKKGTNWLEHKYRERDEVKKNRAHREKKEGKG